MKIISEDIVGSIAPPHYWIDAMEVALLTQRSGDYFTPDRMRININDNTLLLMPSVGPDLYSTKLVSVFPSNTHYSKPSVNGTVILNDGATGEALALINGAKLTAMRTAAVACVGIRHLADPSARNLGVIGAGIQGCHLAWLASKERDIERILVYDPSHLKVIEFMQFLKKHNPGIEVAPCEDEQQVLLNAQIICTATTSKLPVIPNLEDLLIGKTYIGVGAYRPEMQEFPEALYRLVDTVWIDAEHGRLESGDLIQPVENNWINEDRIRHLSQLIQDPGQLDFKETQIFKVVGHGIFDLFAAKLIYQIAEEKNLGAEVQL